MLTMFIQSTIWNITQIAIRTSQQYIARFQIIRSITDLCPTKLVDGFTVERFY